MQKRHLSRLNNLSLQNISPTQLNKNENHYNKHSGKMCLTESKDLKDTGVLQCKNGNVKKKKRMSYEKVICLYII